VCGRIRRSGVRRRARIRPRRWSQTKAQLPPIVSATLPRLARSTPTIRDLPARRARIRRTATRCTTLPGARTTTTTPSRTRTGRPRGVGDRVVRSTSSEWSPGSARDGMCDETVTVAFAPGARESCRGLTASQVVRRAATRGRPRRSSAKPARATSTTTGSAPEFVTVSGALADPESPTCAGDAISATRGPAAPAPAEAARTDTAMRAAASLTGRSACR
jgi:hypothetical protein